MKIIHCADLHLDSKMTSNFDKTKAKERKAEILNTFVGMVKYAASNDISAILIAGDMFDTGVVSALTRSTVLETIMENPDIAFFYLKGNHDRDGFISSLEEVPDNLVLFDEHWKSYNVSDRVVITGIELSRANCVSCYGTLQLDEGDINIVMMHGQEMSTTVNDKVEIIDIRRLKNQSIDYLALGHIHSYKQAKLDARGTYCYPGCLEGRGFDEAGKHGFVLLDIDESTGLVKTDFIPFAHRELVVIKVDISDCINTTQIIGKIDEEIDLEGVEEKNLIEIMLTGEIDIECEKNIDFIEKTFEARFYHVKTSDRSVYKVNFEDYRYDKSLKGEFVRKVMAEEGLSDIRKAEILHIGFKAIAGEEISICD